MSADEVGFESTRLTADHDLSRFDSGKETLDKWLREFALRATMSETARVYVWTELDDNVVQAYYALSPTEVARAADGPTRSRSAGVSRVPGYLIGRPALDRSLQGRGLGGELLYDAVSRAVGAAEVGGGRLIVVDAIDEDAQAFYQKFGFVPVQLREYRLVMTMTTARRAIGPNRIVTGRSR